MSEFVFLYRPPQGPSLSPEELAAVMRERSVSLYDTLLAIRPSPVVALNRAIAVAERDGPAEGLREIRNIPDLGRLATYPFFPAAVGELEIRMGRPAAAREHFEAAVRLARSPMERRFLDQRVAACKSTERQVTQ